MLAVVERRMPAGKRDYAILLLLVTYGLRPREVAADERRQMGGRSESVGDCFGSNLAEESRNRVPKSKRAWLQKEKLDRRRRLC